MHLTTLPAANIPIYMSNLSDRQTEQLVTPSESMCYSQIRNSHRYSVCAPNTEAFCTKIPPVNHLHPSQLHQSQWWYSIYPKQQTIRLLCLSIFGSASIQCFFSDFILTQTHVFIYLFGCCSQIQTLYFFIIYLVEIHTTSVPLTLYNVHTVGNQQKHF